MVVRVAHIKSDTLYIVRLSEAGEEIDGGFYTDERVGKFTFRILILLTLKRIFETYNLFSHLFLKEA